MTPDLTGYDWVVINTSAGKDSQAMMDWVVALARRQGVPLERIVAVHCDLAEEEWPGCRELAGEHARHYGLRFEVVKRARGGILAHVEQRRASLLRDGKGGVPPWPSNGSRWCTSEHKTGQVRKLFTRLARETRERLGDRKHQTRILNCMGMRAGESCRRSKLVPFEFDEDGSNGLRHVDTWLPIHAWSADMVWSRIRHAGTRHHPAYDKGMPRLSCVFCIYSPRNALLLAGQHNRELLDRYVEVEDRVGFTFQAKLSLREVRDALNAGEQPGEIKTWEMP
jgi:3'-phosphoadenosine 5'-phosphosulfate sulfotransferase (PAPS reductase)/FAD synthetase